MRYGFLTITFALVVAVALAQLDITAFPECAVGLFSPQSTAKYFANSGQSNSEQMHH